MSIVRHVLSLIFVGSALLSFADKEPAIDSVYKDSIRNLEYRLETLSYNFINSEDLNERITSCYYFIQTLKEALMVPQSYNYTFTSLKTVSIIKPDDNKFRIFTWNLLLDSGKYMYFGAIQMNNTDSLILYGLYDSSDYNKDPYYETYDNRHWMGALYYQIHHYKYKRKDYYVVFGWDGQDSKTNRKIVDVLWFDDDGKPMFGDEIFNVEGDMVYRIMFDFADNTAMVCHYDAKEKKIVFSNMVPINPIYEGDYSKYVPDGSYDYLKLERGIWRRYSGLFDNRIENSQDLRRL